MRRQAAASGRAFEVFGQPQAFRAKFAFEYRDAPKALSVNPSAKRWLPLWSIQAAETAAFYML
jgi:hypothetical protein